MIPWAAENKYCFDMRVSARAMGSPALSSAAARLRGIDFSIVKQGTAQTERKSPAEADRCATLPRFGITRKGLVLGLAETAEQ